MELGLNDQIVLVAGSSRGIGLAIAQGFLAEGAKVILTGRDKVSLLKTSDALAKQYGQDRVLAVEGDLRKESDIESCKQVLLEKWGHIDHLILNMGSGKASSDMLSDPEQWMAMFEENLNGPYKLVRTFLPLMQSCKKGSIIFIASIAGKEATGAPIDYSSAKAALMALSKNLSKKVADKGIRVNVVAPGNVFFQGSTWDEKIKTEKDKVQRMLEDSVPMKRFATVQEIAMPVLFLSSQQASFITGAVLTVDGGQTCAVLG